MDLADAQALWEPETVYLNTASYGLPPRPAFEALTAALEDWRHGRTSWEIWGGSTEAARTAFARLVGAPAEDIAIGTTVSEFTGMIAGSLPDGAHILVPDMEFTSNLFPYSTHSDRGIKVTTVPAAQLPDAIDSSTTAVAFSVVQSSSGEVAELDAIEKAAAEHDVLTIVDATQACGWLPLDAPRFDFLVVHAYKWLMSPRGTAFLYVNPELREEVRPTGAGWYAGEDVHASYYGPPLRLARSARRFDLSPVWFSWVGTRPSLDVIAAIGVGSIQEHNVRLANLFRERMQLEPSNSAIVSIDAVDATEKLERAGIQAASRAGHLRVSFHVYNDDSDVDALVETLVN
ncbi:MAG: aminotransferase class V-fold PLP-dependent enzyme [Actinomycetota bacterium]